MRYYFILNPGSRGGRSKKAFKRLFQLLDDSAINYEHAVSKNIDEIYTQSARANNAGYDVVVAVGGDGTINAVLNGFFDASGKRFSNSRLGIIYTGTSPDFNKSYNIPVKMTEAVSTLLKNYSIPICVGKLTHATKPDPENEGLRISDIDDAETKYFGCCTNAGIGASLARKANSGIRKYLGDFLGTLLSMFATVASYRPNIFQTVMDGENVLFFKSYSISIGRTRYIASGIKVENELKADDPRFYCLISKNIRLFDIPPSIHKVYKGKQILTSRTFHFEYLKTMEILGNSKNPEVEIDGDPVGFLPCKIEVAEDLLDLIVKRPN